jgi:hypothetical protein
MHQHKILFICLIYFHKLKNKQNPNKPIVSNISFLIIRKKKTFLIKP